MVRLSLVNDERRGRQRQIAIGKEERLTTIFLVVEAMREVTEVAVVTVSSGGAGRRPEEKGRRMRKATIH